MRSWPHGPARRPFEAGAVIVTAGTYLKRPLLATRKHLEIVQQEMFAAFSDANLELEAWSILANHYHFVANGGQGVDLPKVIGQFHRRSARRVNELDEVAGRRVWHQFFDTQITNHASYLARLAYVHRNPEKHGIAEHAEDYEFCSMAWLKRNGDDPWVETLLRFQTDQVRVYDDF